MNKLYRYEERTDVQKHIKYKPKPKDTSHLINYKMEKDYEYYICDWCGDEIKILPKKHEMTGGITTLQHTVTRRGEITLALCNKCIKPVLKIFDEEAENAN